MVEFKNTVNENYFADRLRVDIKIRELKRRYTYLECNTPRCTHCPALIEVFVYRRWFMYNFPITCCRAFERELIVMMRDEMMLYN